MAKYWSVGVYKQSSCTTTLQFQPWNLSYTTSAPKPWQYKMMILNTWEILRKGSSHTLQKNTLLTMRYISLLLDNATVLDPHFKVDYINVTWQPWQRESLGKHWMKMKWTSCCSHSHKKTLLKLLIMTLTKVTKPEKANMIQLSKGSCLDY